MITKKAVELYMKIVFLESHLVTLNNDIDYGKLKKLGDYYQYELSLEDEPIPYAKGYNSLEKQDHF